MPYEVWTTRESPRKLNITKEWYAFCIGKFVTGELSGPAQGIVGPKATISSEVYSYILNINRIFI